MLQEEAVLQVLRDRPAGQRYGGPRELLRVEDREVLRLRGVDHAQELGDPHEQQPRFCQAQRRYV